MMAPLVLDVDGVILDFGSKYLSLAREVLKKEINPNLNKYELQDFLQVNEDENKLVWNEFNDRNCWTCIYPLDGSVEAIQKINDFNIDVFIVSSIDHCHTTARLANLKNIGLVPKGIYCVGDGNAHKHDIISEIKPFAFVDDRLDHLFRSLDVPHLAWVDHKHNQKIECFQQISAKVNSLKEWVDLHLELLVDNNNKNNNKDR